MNGADLTGDVLAWCDRLGGMSEEQGRLTRTFLSAPMRDVHAALTQWMEAIGMRVRVDAAGNLRGRYDAAREGAPTLYIGSHLDTVPNAGRFDGQLGVVLGVALVQALAGERLGYAVEVVGFSEEEGVRFRAPFIGSRAFVGTLDEHLLERQDAQGVTVRDALLAFGLDADDLGSSVAEQGALGFFEVHIEQGPVLESLQRPLGVVDAIAGQSRLDIVFTGSANHAGTTPMRLRRDALAGAAEFILAVEAYARGTDGLVATVGQARARPGAGNVVPGEATVSLDVRHARDDVRERAVQELLATADDIAARRGLFVTPAFLTNQAAVPMDARLTALLREAAGGNAPLLTSGAGHDAMIVAQAMPSAMLFVRSPGGLSHHPDEAVLEEDVRAALAAGEAFVRLLDAEVAAREERHA